MIRVDDCLNRAIVNHLIYYVNARAQHSVEDWRQDVTSISH